MWVNGCGIFWVLCKRNYFMGLSDRDYFRDNYDRKQRSSRGKGKRVAAMSVTMRIVIVNLFLWLANGLFFPDSNLLTAILAMPAGVIGEPLYWYTFLTSGFVHSPSDFMHILFNMIGLLMFGYGIALGNGVGGVGLTRTDNIEWRLGRVEYFLFYILAIIFAGVSHGIFSSHVGGLGASGGVVAIIVMYAFLYPNNTILIMFVIPMPMWVFGIFIVGADFLGAIDRSASGIGYTAHLGGAFFALLYYYFMFKKKRAFTDVFALIKKLAKLPKTKLKIHKSDGNYSDTKNKNNMDEAEFKERLDQILERHDKVGEAGLTEEERKFLQEAVKKYQNKRNR
jgi:membrane associated rhomboid family serine protease